MSIKRSYQCAVCLRAAPSGSCSFVRGVPIGPTCLSRLKRREYIRSNGPNMLVVFNEDSKLAHSVSDYGDMCPDKQIHCLQCKHLTDKQCPAEVKYGHEFKSL